MTIEIDPVGASIAQSSFEFTLNVDFWDACDQAIVDLLHPPEYWQEVKFLNDEGRKNPQLNSLPTDKGGIYVFIVKTNILPGAHQYLLYIGRAHYTATQNLRKRCSQYVTETKRPRIRRMVKQWGKYLYIRYLPMEDNVVIDKIEATLINTILPPFNYEVPDQQIREARNAFSL